MKDVRFSPLERVLSAGFLKENGDVSYYEVRECTWSLHEGKVMSYTQAIESGIEYDATESPGIGWLARGCSLESTDFTDWVFAGVIFPTMEAALEAAMAEYEE